MLHMQGVSSTQYWLGLFFGDLTLHLMPVVVFTALLACVPSLVDFSKLGYFFVAYLMYGSGLISVSYTLQHLFSDEK
jgi:hypothetical protein